MLIKIFLLVILIIINSIFSATEIAFLSLNKYDLHKELKAVLMEEGYLGFISVEMGKMDEMPVIKDTLLYVREVFGDDL